MQSLYRLQFNSKLNLIRKYFMAKMELEIGPSPTGVMLALKSVDGRIHQVTAIEMTNEEAIEISNLIQLRVEENRKKPESSELN